ncbi:heterodimeric geranylgeranyl pyrophosphate synthase small subunit, chloroplastic-like [Impatiens glandulifera]|uniref:heterodimeric geranylgeranyl pyrophosphate synthase small subunit, chloroplastic-like n=1 Tax=Impatiens glandulifera TaxID=253017 RepID=UPI001FB0F8DC|nr:heterodimeric geranylgeranyl pyrophosphate synthase small subunit, chloroplastic-like [Impatiens glandulifera]
MASAGLHSLFKLNPHHQIKESYWSTIDTEINDHLKRSISKIHSPQIVVEPMHHLTFAAPPTTAPALCIAACELVGGNRHQAIAAASALKLMHSAAYAHEQLPFNNNGQHMFSPNIELLTGDGMVPFGFELLSRSCDVGMTESSRVLRVIAEMARAIGSEGMVGGNRHGLYGCGAACGAILGGGEEVEIERLRKYGVYVGMLIKMEEEEGKEKWERIARLRELAFKELDIFPSEESEEKKVWNNDTLVMAAEESISGAGAGCV